MAGTYDAGYLAACRVKKPGCMEYKSMDMTSEQVSDRRAYMRKLLLKTIWGNSSNEVLDGIRVWKVPPGDEFFLEDENGYEFYLPTGKLDLNAGAFRKARSMVPFEFVDKTMKDFNWSEYGGCDVSSEKQLLFNFLSEFDEFRKKGMGLYIYSGTKGSGKTLLASIILNEISRRYAVNTKFVSVLDFIEMTKRGFNDEGGEVKMIYNAAVLVVDDLGVQMSKEWIESSLYQLINYRYINKLVTIYTSNIRHTDMKIDDRITDRIDATTYPLNLPEIAVRHRKKQAEKEKFMSDIVSGKKLSP